MSVYSVDILSLVSGRAIEIRETHTQNNECSTITIINLYPTT